VRNSLTIKAKRDIIAELKKEYKITALLKTLGLKHDAYYYKPHPTEIPEEQIEAVKKSFYESNRAYGQDKIAKDIHRSGMQIAPKTVGKIMKQEGLVSKYTLKRKPNNNTTNHENIDDKLQRNFGGYKTREVVVSDLTYVKVREKWCYICLIVELSHREIIGYSAGANKDAKLVQDAFYSVNGSLSDIGIWHTDRGGEFKNDDIDEILTTFGIDRSLSRPGTPIDNAVSESMYDILKTEFIFDEVFTNLTNLRKRLSDWVEWYNTKRLHSSLGNIPPVESRLTREIGVAFKERPNMEEINRKKKKKREAAILAAQITKDNKKAVK
jgi:transposase InsO family protein